MSKKVLYKNKKDKMISGVCAGISDYMDIDVSLIRIAMVFFGFWGGSGVLAYIVAAIILPNISEVKK